MCLHFRILLQMLIGVKNEISKIFLFIVKELEQFIFPFSRQDQYTGKSK